MEKNRVITTIEQFIKGGDEVNVVLLDQIIHSDYKNLLGCLLHADNVGIMDKTHYLQLIKSRKPTDTKRKMTILDIEINGTMAFSKVLLESMFKRVVTLIILIREEEHWYIIGDYPDITMKRVINLN